MLSNILNFIELLLMYLSGYLALSLALVTLSKVFSVILSYLSRSGKFVLLSFIQFIIAIYHVFAIFKIFLR